MPTQKLIVILGPTATGKSDLAVEIARIHNGEVISADSRQVYMGLDIGTGKITEREMRGVPHHMLDVISPKKIFSVSEWQKGTRAKITEIIARGKLPIICGGTGFYIQSIVDAIVIPEVPPNKTLRKKLETMSTQALSVMLQKLDPKRLETIDTKNPVRLIRAIEIATALGSVPKQTHNENPYDILQIGLTLPDNTLKEKIDIRLQKRMKKGMLAEIKEPHTSGLSWKRMNELGLEYRFLAQLAQGKMSRTECMEKLGSEIRHYAKRQMTWFKRDMRIHWVAPTDTKQIEKIVQKFLTEK